MSTPDTISAYVQLGTLLAIAVFTFINTIRSKKAAVVAEKAAVVAEKIHGLVNSNFGAQLRIVSLQARRIAELTTGKQAKKEAMAVAAEAERLYQEHETNQKAVDAAAANK